MGQPKCHEFDYIDFLIATPRAASCCEASRSQPPTPNPPAHDAYTRLLHRLEPDPETLYREVEPFVNKDDGVLVIDDSTLDKLYSKKIEPVHRHWSGKHKSVVCGINLISLVWTDGDRIMPLDYRIFDKPKDGLTKNDHFRDLIKAAKQRGFSPRAVVFDSWYSSMDNLKLIRDCSWTFLTQLKANRKVDLNRTGYQAVSNVPIDSAGTIVHLEGFGSIRVFKVVSQDGDVEYWATNDLAMDELKRLELAERCWAVEE
jgi:putative transposase